MAEKERNYGIDLLRITSMMMVITLHVLGRGGGLTGLKNLTFKGEIGWLMSIACYGAVNCYALISGYVGVGAKHRYSSIIQLWIQVLFYSLLSSVIVNVMNVVNGGSISFGDLLGSCLPVFMQKYWYFTAYFALFFFMPLLNHIINTAPKKVLKSAFLAAVALFFVIESVRETFDLAGGYSFLWLAILYLIGGYIAKYKPFENWAAKRCFLAYFVCVLAISLSRIAIALVTRAVLGSIQHENFFLGYVDFFVVFGAIFLVLGFSKLNVTGTKMRRLISWVSPLTFGVYLAHLTPLVWDWLYGRFVFFAQYNTVIIVALTVGIVLAIFVVCALIDFLRLQLFKLFKIKKFSAWLEKWIGKLIALVLKFLRIRIDEEPSNTTNEINE